MSEWVVLLLTSLGAWCVFSLVLGVVIGPLLRKQDVTALAPERRGVTGT